MNKNQLETLQELAHIGLWEFDLTTKTLTWSNEIYNIFEMDKNSFIPTYENFIKVLSQTHMSNIVGDTFQTEIMPNFSFKNDKGFYDNLSIGYGGMVLPRSYPPAPVV